MFAARHAWEKPAPEPGFFVFADRNSHVVHNLFAILGSAELCDEGVRRGRVADLGFVLRDGFGFRGDGAERNDARGSGGEGSCALVGAAGEFAKSGSDSLGKCDLDGEAAVFEGKLRIGAGVSKTRGCGWRAGREGSRVEHSAAFQAGDGGHGAVGIGDFG